MNADVVLLDYGVGNMFSVSKALSAAGARVVRTSDPDAIGRASRLVVPGVGAFGACAQRLRGLDMWEPLQAYLALGRPLLGICVGMQLLLEISEEFGKHKGLAHIHGRVQAVPPTGADGRPHRIPNVGWWPLAMAPSRNSWDETILAGTQVGEHFYFIHSYMAVPSNPSDHLASIDYNGRTICAAVQRGPVFGCQFHPEKSGPAGQVILKQFLRA